LKCFWIPPERFTAAGFLSEVLQAAKIRIRRIQAYGLLLIELLECAEVAVVPAFNDIFIIFVRDVRVP